MYPTGSRDVFAVEYKAPKADTAHGPIPPFSPRILAMKGSARPEVSRLRGRAVRTSKIEASHELPLAPQLIVEEIVAVKNGPMY